MLSSIPRQKDIDNPSCPSLNESKYYRNTEISVVTPYYTIMGQRVLDFSMPSFFIRLCSVDGFKPRILAAPFGP